MYDELKGQKLTPENLLDLAEQFQSVAYCEYAVYMISKDNR